MSSNVLLIENLHGCKSGSKCRDSQSEAIIFGVWIVFGNNPFAAFLLLFPSLLSALWWSAARWVGGALDEMRLEIGNVVLWSVQIMWPLIINKWLNWLTGRADVQSLHWIVWPWSSGPVWPTGSTVGSCKVEAAVRFASRRFQCVLQLQASVIRLTLGVHRAKSCLSLSLLWPLWPPSLLSAQCRRLASCFGVVRVVTTAAECHYYRLRVARVVGEGGEQRP